MQYMGLKKYFLKHLINRCGEYKKLHKMVNNHKSIFKKYGITTYLNEINFDDEETMLLVKKCLEELMGTDENIHCGYNDPEQGETGEDGGKYYLFVTYKIDDIGWWK